MFKGLCVGIVGGLLLVTQPVLADGINYDESRWEILKQDHFGDRKIRDGEGVIGVDAPFRAADAALVPIGVEDLRSGRDAPEISRLYLFIDQNPVPLVGTIEFGPAARSVDVATRVRVDSYTFVRAIAETVDGELYMAKRHVRASGGCSAPVGADEEEALRDMGMIRVRAWDAREEKGGSRVQLGIRHPNFSGLQMDQVTRLYRRAHYVNSLEITADGKRVLKAELTIAVSRDPSLRFYVVPEVTDRELVIIATDSEKNEFRHADVMRPAPAPIDFSAEGRRDVAAGQGSAP